jgi:hypothetical protein
MATDAEKKNDMKVLVDLLTLIEQQLHVLVHDRQHFFRKEFRQYLPGPWPEVARHFSKARQLIEDGQLEWEYVEGVGLTGDTLLWKQNILKESIRQKVFGRFLKVANSFLGSLLKGLPIVEFIKEYKDFVEGCLKMRSDLRE